MHPGKSVFLGEQRQPARLRSRRQHNEGLLVAFTGVTTPEAASELRNQNVYVERASLPELPDGELYHHQLIGLEVAGESGRVLGSVVELLETGNNDVMVVRPESGAEILLPTTDEVLLEVNLAEGRLRVHLLPGLLPGEEAEV